MGRFIKGYLGPLLIAVIATATLAVVFQTQRVIAMMGAVGGEVTLSERLSMTLYDLKHLGSLYGIFIFIALLIALTAALFLSRAKPSLSKYFYMGAGAIAMIVLLFTMKQAFFDVHIIAGARDGFGQALQMLAGAFGGYMFWRLRQTRLTAEQGDKLTSASD